MEHPVNGLEHSRLYSEKHTTQLRKSMLYDRGAKGSALKLHDGSNLYFCVSTKETRNRISC